MATTFILKSKTFGKKFDAMKGKFKGAGAGEVVDGEIIEDVTKKLPIKSTAKETAKKGIKFGKKSKIALTAAGLATAGAVGAGIVAKKKNKKKD